MRWGSSRLWILIAMIIGMGVGCASKSVHEPVVVTPTGQIVVSDPPPTPREEKTGAAPYAGWAWIPGYWSHHNARWFWVPGRWQAPPAKGSAWVAGHWDRTERGWVWTPGRWE
jgi:hypothetical protein